MQQPSLPHYSSIKSILLKFIYIFIFFVHEIEINLLWI